MLRVSAPPQKRGILAKVTLVFENSGTQMVQEP